MDPPKVVLFYELCRLCLDKPGAHEIFETETLSENIKTLTSVIIKRTDNLPQKLCTKCLEVVNNASELRVLAIKNDMNLRNLFNDDVDFDSDSSEVTLKIDIPDIETESTFFTQSNQHPFKRKVLSSDECKDTTSEPPSKISIRKDLFHNKSTEKIKSEPQSEEKEKIRHKYYEKTGLYECVMCLKKYKTYKKLYLHNRTHNKTLDCPLGCGKKFATKQDLKKHERVHTGERPFKCDQCEKSFNQRVTLKAHKESIHGSTSSVK